MRDPGQRPHRGMLTRTRLYTHFRTNVLPHEHKFAFEHMRTWAHSPVGAFRQRVSRNDGNPVRSSQEDKLGTFAVQAQGGQGERTKKISPE